jgi:hypothetical protein
LILGILFMSVVASQPPKGVPPPPELGGQHVLAKHYQIRFDQKYDFFCSFYWERETIPQTDLLLSDAS